MGGNRQVSTGSQNKTAAAVKELSADEACFGENKLEEGGATVKLHDAFILQRC